MSKSEEWMIPDESDLDDALGQAIGEAMEPERCDSDDFAAGIRERIEGSEGGASKLSVFARSAAAFMPPILLPKGMLKGGATAGGFTLKNVGWKAFPGVMAFPAVILMMVTVTFIMSVRRASVSGPQREERKDAQAEVAAWWRKFIVPVALTIVVLILFGKMAPLEAILLFVAVSMVFLVGIYGVLARAGLATRREIGYRAGGFLFNLVVYGQIFSGLADTLGLDQAWAFGVPMCLALGAAWCIVLGAGDNASGKQAWKGWMAVVGCAVLMLVLSYLSGLGKETAGRADALQYVQAEGRSGANLRSYANDIAGAAWYLGTDGGEAPDLEGVEKDVHAWIDMAKTTEKGPDLNYLGLLGVEDLGLLREKDYAAFRDNYRQSKLLTDKRSILDPKHTMLQIVQRELEQPLTNSEKDIIVSRVLGWVKKESTYNGAEDLYYRSRILEKIGRHGDVAKLEKAVQIQLRDTWVTDLAGKHACFAPGLKSLEPSKLVPEPRKGLYSGWIPASDYSLRLMVRFGVPDHVDLTLFDAYLADCAKKHKRIDLRGGQARAAAMRAFVRSTHEWQLVPDPHILAVVFRYRLFLAGLILSLFCVFVTLRTPKTVLLETDSAEEEAEGPGSSKA